MMQTILHLVSDLGPTGANRQLSLIAPALEARGFNSRIINLGTSEPFEADLRMSGVSLENVPLSLPFAIAGMDRLRRIVVANRPDLVHLWGHRAAIWMNFIRLPGIRWSPMPPVVATVTYERIAPLARYFVSRTLNRVKVISGIPLAVDTQLVTAIERHAIGIPTNARLIVAAGGFDNNADMKSIIWAFDVLKHTSPDWFLYLIGDVPLRSHLQRFNQNLAFDDNRVRFAGLKVNVREILATADCVWLTQKRGGTNFALEAMAAGVSVVAARNDDLSSIIEDGKTGYLTTMGVPAEMAARTKKLFDDAPLRKNVGENARKAAIEKHAIADIADVWARKYSDIMR